jgi:hypothetical protein
VAPIGSSGAFAAQVLDSRGVSTLALVPIVRIDGSQLTDWETFHDAFAAVLGFPAFYGRNMNAWIDCMTSLDSPEDGMTTIHGDAADPVVLHIANASSIPSELFYGLNECAAFVNWRRIEAGEPPILALSFWRAEPTTR